MSKISEAIEQMERDLSLPRSMGGTFVTSVKDVLLILTALKVRTEALADLYADCTEYTRINNLHNSDGSPATNHAMRRAATALSDEIDIGDA